MAKMKKYKPLPNTVTIRNSSIHGLGLFATTYIKEGTEIGVSHFECCGQLHRTPLGAFYNHSEEPNCIKVKQAGSVYILTTLREIKPCEEITVNYTFYTI